MDRAPASGAGRTGSTPVRSAMDTYKTLMTRRTIRAFTDTPISEELLTKFVEAARLSPQAANRQPLEYIVVDDQRMLEEFFANTKLGGYVDWEPEQKEMPQAYIAIVADLNRQKTKWIAFDTGIAAENICLAAWNEGIGSCMIGAFNKTKISALLDIPISHELILLVALGYPAQESVTEDKDQVEYWIDKDGKFHVPKRPLSQILHHNKFTQK